MLAPSLSVSELAKKVRNDPNKLKGLQYAKDWDANDFYGAFHIDRFQNKIAPIPGTQVLLEQQHEEKRALERRQFEENLITKTGQRRRNIEFKQLMGEFKTRIDIDVILGTPIREIEAVIEYKTKLTSNKIKFGDTQKQINTFMKNVKLGRHHYISFASNTGFRSMDYQEPDTGDTALHIAVRKGYIEVVEELLKFRASPDLKNKLGNNPIHDAWFFWSTAANLKVEERLEQESKTIQILYKILSYGGGVDNQDQYGQTPLHIACRLGTMRAVLTVLGFKADVKLRTKTGLLAQDVAKKHNEIEIFQILKVWDKIHHAMVHADFTVLWGRFMKDYESIISNVKSAESILFDIEMDLNIKKLERQGQKAIMIDDALLRQSYTEMKKCEQIPKPWDEGWNIFVSYCESQGTVDPLAHKNDFDPETGELKKHIAAKLAKRAKAEEEELIEKQQAAIRAKSESINGQKIEKEKSYAEKFGFKEKSKYVEDEEEIIEQNVLVEKIAHRWFPDRKDPIARPRTRQGTPDYWGNLMNPDANLLQIEDPKENFQNDNNLVVDEGFIDDGNNDSSVNNLLTNSIDNQSTMSDITGFPTLSFTENDGDSSHEIVNKPSIISNDIPRPSTTNAMDRLYDVPSQDSRYDTPANYERPLSQLRGRRKQVVNLVSLDAKFYSFTKRPATSSAIFLPLRKPSAPMDGTEEQDNIVRMIASQGQEWDLVNKVAPTAQSARLKAMIGKIEKSAKNSIGAYCDEVMINSGSAKDEIYNRLIIKPLSQLEEANLKLTKGMKTIEAGKQKKVDMINGKRARFVDSELLPVERERSLVERMAIEAREKKKADTLAILGGAEGARKLLEEGIQSASVGDDSKEDPLPGGIIGDAGKAKKERMASLFLQKPKVVYGKGRLTSTHNSKGELETPWSVTGGRYATKPGDRTR